MNRFAVSGLIDEMHAGKRIVVFGSSHTFARQIFTEIAEYVSGDTVRRANGAERIESSNGPGWIQFHTLGSTGTARGLSADILYIEDPDHRLTRGRLAELEPIVAGSPCAEIVRA